MDKISSTIKKIRPLDYKLMELTQKRLDNLTKPLGSLGRLEELSRQICGITGKVNPLLENKVIFTLSADHGVTAEGVSAYPKEVTAQMVYNFLNGGAGINVLARHIKARVIVADMGVASKLQVPSFKFQAFRDKKINFGTKNMTQGPAMTRAEAIKSIESGIELLKEEVPRGIDILGTGDMGIGNTTASSAITAIFTKKLVENVTGKGTGLDGVGLKHKIAIIKKALAVNQPDPGDPIDVLAKVGGFEIGGLAGIILAAASQRIPIVIDGFISGAAALLASRIEPKVKEYMIAAHKSAEKGHKVILAYLDLRPLFDLDLRLGEGSGAALGIGLAEAAIKILTQMATFKNANVSERENNG